MALVVKDRVRETSTTTGTGTFTLAGAVTGYQSFSAVGNGNTTYYTIYLQGGNEWEVGIGTYTASGTTLSRDTILASSNGGSAVNFSAGTKDVFVTYPAGRSVYYDTATNVTLNALTVTGALAANGGTTIGDASGDAFTINSSAVSTPNGLNFDSNTLVVDAANNRVGIGTASPGSSLDVQGASLRLNLQSTSNGQYATWKYVGKTSAGAAASFEQGINISADNAFEIYDNTNTQNVSRYYSGASGYWQWMTNGTEKLRITSGGQVNIGGNFTSTNNTLQVTGNAAIGYTAAAPTTGLIVAGNVGIGTDSPGARLQVGTRSSSTAADNSTVFVAGAASASGGTAVVATFANTVAAAANNEAQITFTPASNYSAVGAIGSVIESTSPPAAGLKFYTYSQTVLAERMRLDSAGTLILRQSSNAANTSVSFNTTVQNALTLDSSGNLGVGVASPAAKLNVVSTGDMSGLFETTGTSNAAAVFVRSGNGTTSGLYAYVRFVNYDTNAQDWRIGTYGNNNLSFYNAKAVTTPMVLDTSGNLGIGETSPAYKLDVNKGSAGTVARFRASTDNARGLTFTSSDNGIFLGAIWTRDIDSASGIHVWSINGTERARIDSSGNLKMNASTYAIGTAIPGGTGANCWWIDGQGPSTGVIRLRALGPDASTNGSYTFQTARSDNSNIVGALTLDSSGNLGLGVTPSAWSTGKAIEVGSLGTALYGYAAGYTLLTSGAYFNSGWKYANSTTKPTYYSQGDGLHYWYTAPSGTAGNAITFTQAMTLDASGNLLVGATSGTNVLTVIGASQMYHKYTGGTGAFQWGQYDTSGNVSLNNQANANMLFATNNTERARITSGGDILFVGSSAAFAKSTTSCGQLYYDSANGYVYLSASSNTGYGTMYFNVTNAGTNSTALALNYNGNVGVGTTNPSYKLHVSGTNIYSYVESAANTSFAFQRVTAGTTTPIGIELSADHGATLALVGTFTNHPLIFRTNNTERARIAAANGNFLIQVTDPAMYDTNAGSDVNTYYRFKYSGGNGSSNVGVALSNDSNSAAVGFWRNNDSSKPIRGAAIQSVYTSTVAGSEACGLSFLTQTGGAAAAERGRFTSGGYFKASNDGLYRDAAASYHELRQTNDVSSVIVSVTNASYTAEALLIEAARNTTNNTFHALSYYNSGAAAYKFRVADSGNVTNTNGSYGTISDAKMKTDIVDAGSQWSDIKAIRFRKFKMKDDPEQIVQLGVVAQEIEQTSPGLVEEHIDRDAEGNDLGTTTKSVKSSILLMKAAVALQEAMARIEQLEAKVAALETKGA